MHGTEKLEVKKPPRAANGRIIGGAAAAIVVGCAFGAYLLLKPAETRMAAPSAVVERASNSIRITEKQLAAIDVAPVELRPFRIEKSAVGQIAFNDHTVTPVLAPFSGRITRLIAKIGDQVTRGTPLFEIDSPEIVQAQNELIAASQALEKSKAQLALAKTTLDRAKELFAARAGAKRDLDQAENNYANAGYDMHAAQGNLTAVRNRLLVLGRSDDEISRLDRDRAMSSTITVTAPIDGTVVSRKVGPGQYVRSDNIDPLYLIADLRTMWLKAHVVESDIALIRDGQEVEVKVNALPDRVFTARIASVGVASDPVTHRVVVRSEVPNPEGLLKPEMFARFRIDTGEAEETPAVPMSAVIRHGDLKSCWVETEPRVFQRRNVRIGLEQDGKVQILDGVRPGERVAARGAIFLDNQLQD
jgi:cobalt-zinc-cadmium efflux system membrane fusion protein